VLLRERHFILWENDGFANAQLGLTHFFHENRRIGKPRREDESAFLVGKTRRRRGHDWASTHPKELGKRFTFEGGTLPLLQQLDYTILSIFHKCAMNAHQKRPSHR
jgi:hypothetical protein